MLEPFLALPLLMPGALPQDESPADLVELEALSGAVRRVERAGFRTADPRREEAVLVRFVGLAPPPPPTPAAGEEVALELRGGDRLAGAVRGGEGESVTLELAGGTRLALSVEELRALVFPGRLPADAPPPLPPEEGDRLYLARGRGLDKIDGLVEGFGPDGVRFEGPFGPRTYGWDAVAALFVEALGDAAPAAAEVPVVVDLADGGRLSGGLSVIDEQGVRLVTRAGSELALPAALVREVSVDDGSFRFLSQLPIDAVGPTDLFGGGDDLGMRYPPNVDANFRGDPLRAGGRTWTRGLGVHAPSHLTWTLDGGWAELRGHAAVDDSALENEFPGSVVFRVHVDGDLRWESPVVRGGETPVELPAIDLGGARQLVLEVDAATEAFVSDRADWLRPLLVRARER